MNVSKSPLKYDADFYYITQQVKILKSQVFTFARKNQNLDFGGLFVFKKLRIFKPNSSVHP
jgi:hypothetical protein